MRLFYFVLLILCISVVRADYGYSLGDKLKYSSNSSHFSYVNPNASKGGSLIVPMTGTFDSLNPFSLKGEHEVGINMLTLDTLLEQSEDEAFSSYGLIADDIKLADDGLSVRFHINPKARFHNGDFVLAKDVEYSFNVLTKDVAASPFYRMYWSGVKSVKVINQRTIDFIFKEKNAELHLILGQLPIFSHKSFPNGLSDGNVIPIGSGPYRLKRTINSRVSEFERDKNYWAKDLFVRKGMFNFDLIKFRYYQDETARVEALKAGEYDILEENVARLWARSYPDKVLKKKNLIKKTFQHQNNAGMQGFVLNLRRPILQDEALRRALNLSFDFESVNRLLFYGLYKRDNSFFTNTELAATGRPEKQELEILKSVSTYLPNDILSTPAIEPPKISEQQGVRSNLILAKELLLANGYRYKNGYLIDKQGRQVVLEFLTYSKAFERVVAKWRKDLAKIGITLNVRVTDSALFQKRVNDFDYDITVGLYGNTLSPGNEQYNYHSCLAAKTNGSQNYAGVCDEAIEKILPHFTNYKTRSELVSASRALDRILRRKYIIIPNWYSDKIRMIYKNDLAYPQVTPRYYRGLSWAIKTWWKQ